MHPTCLANKLASGKLLSHDSPKNFKTKFITTLLTKGLEVAFSELENSLLPMDIHSSTKQLNSIANYLSKNKDLSSILGTVNFNTCKSHLARLLARYNKSRSWFSISNNKPSKLVKGLIHSCNTIELDNPDAITRLKQQLSKTAMKDLTETLHYLNSTSIVNITTRQVCIGYIESELFSRKTKEINYSSTIEPQSAEQEIRLNQKQVKFKQFLKSIACNGYKLLNPGKGGKGSHTNKFYHPHYQGLFLNIQPDKEGNAKGYQVHQFKQQLEKINALMKSTIAQNADQVLASDKLNVNPTAKVVANVPQEESEPRFIAKEEEKQTILSENSSVDLTANDVSESLVNESEATSKLSNIISNGQISLDKLTHKEAEDIALEWGAYMLTTSNLCENVLLEVEKYLLTLTHHNIEVTIIVAQLYLAGVFGKEELSNQNKAIELLKWANEHGSSKAIIRLMELTLVIKDNHLLKQYIHQSLIQHMLNGKPEAKLYLGCLLYQNFFHSDTADKVTLIRQQRMGIRFIHESYAHLEFDKVTLAKKSLPFFLAKAGLIFLTINNLKLATMIYSDILKHLSSLTYDPKCKVELTKTVIHNLGFIYEKSNSDQAIAYYRISAALGKTDSYCNMAQLYLAKAMEHKSYKLLQKTIKYFERGQKDKENLRILIRLLTHIITNCKEEKWKWLTEAQISLLKQKICYWENYLQGNN
jgi:hypothetical protein